MPQLVDKKRIGRRFDKRYTIADEDRARVKRLAKKGLSQRAIERKLEGRISRRSIGFILHPEKYEDMKEKQVEGKHHLRYYDTDKHREYMQKHRAHKKDLNSKKLI